MMMEPAQDQHGENRADWLNCAGRWRILAQGWVSACHHSISCTAAAGIEGAVRRHDDMVEALATNRAHQSFDIGILPRRARRDRSISDPQCPKAPDDDLPLSAISITDAHRLAEIDPNHDNFHWSTSSYPGVRHRYSTGPAGRGGPSHKSHPDWRPSADRFMACTDSVLMRPCRT